MLSIEQSIVVNRPVEQVFDYVTDVEKMVDWTGPTIEASQTSDGPLGVGTTTSRISKFLGRRMDTQMQITEFEPNKLMVSKAISGPMPEFEERISFESVEGGTKVTIKLEGEMGGLFKLATPILERRVRGQVANDTETLKVLLEATS